LSPRRAPAAHLPIALDDSAEEAAPQVRTDGNRSAYAQYHGAMGQILSTPFVREVPLHPMQAAAQPPVEGCGIAPFQGFKNSQAQPEVASDLTRWG
jgi:hypothetical protein